MGDVINQYFGCGSCDSMCLCNVVFMNVENMPTPEHATRNHAYVLPDDTVWTLNSAGTAFIQLNGSKKVYSLEKVIDIENKGVVGNLTISLKQEGDFAKMSYSFLVNGNVFDDETATDITYLVDSYAADILGATSYTITNLPQDNSVVLNSPTLAVEVGNTPPTPQGVRLTSYLEEGVKRIEISVRDLSGITEGRLHSGSVLLKIVKDM